MGWTFYNSSGQQLRNTGTVLATQAEMEAGSSIAAFVTPGRTQHHPGVAKAWIRFQIDGNVTGDYNVDSVTDTDVGNWTVTFGTDFSEVHYATAIATQSDGVLVLGYNEGQDLGAVHIGGVNDADARADPSYGVHVISFGDQ
jgi:hypothetical protein